MNVNDPRLIEVTRGLALEGFKPGCSGRDGKFGSSPLWGRTVGLGSELWLDTGDIGAIEKTWTREFSGLTTNNTLLNKEIQKGTYDELIPRSARTLRDAVPGLDDAFLVREIAFVLNAYHGLRLVERFGSLVSVEEHTDLAHDVESAVAYGMRYHAICKERFIVKLPLTAAGLLAARRLAAEKVPVNLTLGFSARHNVLGAAIAQPAYCNVFLGRLNQVVSESKLGDGNLVGEKATVASQRAVKVVRDSLGIPTKQIAASLRSGAQVRDLVGIDVLTIPPKAADEFAGMSLDPAGLKRTADECADPRWADGVVAKTWALDSLWDVPRGLAKAASRIASRAGSDPAALQTGLHESGFGDILPNWTEADAATATADGKIPKLERWKERLATGQIGLDALMNLHGLQSFAVDQKAMDDRIRGNL